MGQPVVELVRRLEPRSTRARTGAAAIALVHVCLGLVLAGVSLGASPGGTEAGVTGLRVRLEPVADRFEQPVLLIGAGDGTGDRYVLEQRGSIWRIDAGGVVSDTPMLDIGDRVHYQHERGMLGLAFHPDFEENGRLFVTYSRRGDFATVLSEFTLPETAAELPEASERALLVLPQPSHFHKGGMLEFDAQGMLVFSVGDGGGDPSLNELGRTSMLGTLLRIDVDSAWPYGLPIDNGFAGVPGAHPEIHAIGLRNPWRFSIDQATGHIYIGDVGDSAWEEIDVLPSGSTGVSFGWSDMEGLGCFEDRPCDPAGHRKPALAYPHIDGEMAYCAVIGGYVYRGAAGTLPDGLYLFADYCSGTIWGAPADELVAGTAKRTVIGQLDKAYGQPLAFGQDDAGELYLTTDGGYVLHIVREDDA